MTTIEIAKKPLLVQNLVLIDGISRAGKFFLGRIVDGFERVEHFLVSDMIELVPYLERLGTIREDAAISLLQAGVDAAVYQQKIGRNLNLRVADGSSVLRNFNAVRYLERCFSNDGQNVIREIKKERTISVFVTHETLPNIKIFLKAFPRFQMINILRHPVDLIYSWYRRGWGKRETRDPLSLSPFVKAGRESAPWFAYEWSKDYRRLSRMDRIIGCIESVMEMRKKTFRSLPVEKRKRILFVTYEDLVENSWEVVSVMSSFLKTAPSRFMSRILKREKCLRRIPSEERAKKRDIIKKFASRKMFDTMMRLAGEYDEKSGLFAMGAER